MKALRFPLGSNGFLKSVNIDRVYASLVATTCKVSKRKSALLSTPIISLHATAFLNIPKARMYASAFFVNRSLGSDMWHVPGADVILSAKTYRD